MPSALRREQKAVATCSVLHSTQQTGVAGVTGCKPNVLELLGVTHGERVGEPCEGIVRAESRSQFHRITKAARLLEGEKMAPLCARVKHLAEPAESPGESAASTD